MFTQIEPGYAILASRGVYRQVKIYERKGRIYAAYGTGFIGLYTRNGTTLPNVRCEELLAPDIVIARSELGYLVNPVIYTGKKLPL